MKEKQKAFSEEFEKVQKKKTVRKRVSAKAWKIPEGLDRIQKIEWEIDNRLSGGRDILDLTLKQLFDISKTHRQVNHSGNSDNKKQQHPNNNQEPMR